ncbi:MAG: methyltransferase domain-containing protein [Patescibacteria group bacterium]
MKKSELSEIESKLDNLLQDKNSTHGLQRAVRNLNKELQIYKNHLDGSENLDFKIKGKVQIGGGRHPKKGYLNIDIFPPADVIYDIREGIPLKNDSVSFIFNEHFLEHLDYPISVKKVIKECLRVLKPGGKLVIGVPDGGNAIQKYVKQDKKFFKKMLETWYKGRKNLKDFNTYIDLVNYIFRDQDDDDTFTPHLWAYDLEKLQSLMFEAGFSKAKKWKFDPTIAREKREWASVYVEGVK